MDNLGKSEEAYRRSRHQLPAEGDESSRPNIFPRRAHVLSKFGDGRDTESQGPSQETLIHGIHGVGVEQAPLFYDAPALYAFQSFLSDIFSISS